jgi:hypothetical protein
MVERSNGPVPTMKKNTDAEFPPKACHSCDGDEDAFKRRRRVWMRDQCNCTRTPVSGLFPGACLCRVGSKAKGGLFFSNCCTLNKGDVFDTESWLIGRGQRVSSREGDCEWSSQGGKTSGREIYRLWATATNKGIQLQVVQVLRSSLMDIRIGGTNESVVKRFRNNRLDRWSLGKKESRCR